MGGSVGVSLYLSGMIMACAWVIATLFLRYWRETHDRLFLLFAIAFFAFGLSRLRAFIPQEDDWSMYAYLLRLVAFATILVAVIDKNLHTPQPPAG